jgi:hypothetical protein
VGSRFTQPMAPIQLRNFPFGVNARGLPQDIGRSMETIRYLPFQVRYFGQEEHEWEEALPEEHSN